LRDFILNIRRGQTPFYARLNRIARSFRGLSLHVPRWLTPVGRALYNLHFALWSGVRWLLAVFYNTPLFQSRCETAGPGLFVFILPHVVGHTRIRIGTGVRIYGKVGIFSGRICDDPTLLIKDRVFIGHLVQFVVNKEVIVEEDVLIASRCFIADSDGHPRDAEGRAKGLPPAAKDVKPVRICRRAWIGEGAMILKGVTIGEGAIVGAGSVILKDVPPFCIVMGNPARVVGFASEKPSEVSAV
jgi:acetyltransferase-like isoleucine patch superfamily enzyme